MRSLLWLPAATGPGPSGDRLPPAAPPSPARPDPGALARFPAAPGGPGGSAAPHRLPRPKSRLCSPHPSLPEGARLGEAPHPPLAGVPGLRSLLPHVLFSPLPPAWGPPQPSPLLSERLISESGLWDACLLPPDSGCPGGAPHPSPLLDLRSLCLRLRPLGAAGWDVRAAQAFRAALPGVQPPRPAMGPAPSLSRHPGFMPAPRPSPRARRRASCPGGADPQFPGSGRQWACALPCGSLCAGTCVGR